MTSALLLFGLCLGYWPSVLSLLQLWLDGDQGYGHGMWTSSLAAYFIWQRWRGVQSERLASPLMMGLAIGISAFWTLCYLSHQQSLHQAFFAVQVLWLMTLLLGQPLKPLLLPALLWLTGLPIWSTLLIPGLQKMAVLVTSIWLEAFQLPAWIVAEKIQLPFGALVIAGGCSGLRYLLVAVALTTSYALLNRLSLRHSGLLIVVAALSAIIMNWLRIAAVLQIAYHSQMQHPWVQDHNLLGWVLFAITMLPVWWLARRLPSQSTLEISTSTASTTKTIGGHKNRRLTLLALLTLPLVGYALTFNSLRFTAPLPILPSVIDDAFATPSQSAWQMQLINADGQHSASYHPTNAPIIEARLAWYQHQTQGHELDAGDNRWLPNWPVLARDSNSARLQGADGQYQANWCYVVSGQVTANLHHAKWLAFKQLLNLRHPRQDAMMLVVLQAQNDSSHLSRELSNFATHLCAALAESGNPVLLPAAD